MTYNITYDTNNSETITGKTRKSRSDKGKKRGSYKPRLKNAIKEMEKASKAREKAKKKAEREAKRAERNKLAQEKALQKSIKQRTKEYNEKQRAIKKAQREQDRYAREQKKKEREIRKLDRLAKLSDDERKKRDIAERVRKLSSALGKDKEYMRNLIDDIDALPGVQINEKSQTLSVKSELSKEELFALDKKVRKLEDVVEDTKKRLESMVGPYEVQKMSMQDIYDQVNARSFMDDSFEKLKEHYYATIENLQNDNNIRTAEYDKMWSELQDLGSQYREATSYTDLLNLIDKIREISELRIN